MRVLRCEPLFELVSHLTVQHTFDDLDTGLPKNVNARAVDFGVRVAHRNHHAPNA